LLEESQEQGMAFLSTSIPGPSISLARALEKNGFRYAEGFVNWVGPTHEAREEFLIPNLTIREFQGHDLGWITEAYSKVEFPSRFVTDGGFDKKRAKELYVRRFQEVYKEKLGKIFVAELEGRFAGAIIAIIDERMAKTIGIKTNALSGMGIIIHPDMSRKGVATALIEHRQAYYKSMRVEYVNFGANFSNLPMIRGLEKLGLKFGSVDMAFHKWFQ
jgi:GNAT superfamily N-acetyltransferase